MEGRQTANWFPPPFVIFPPGRASAIWTRSLSCRYANVTRNVSIRSRQARAPVGLVAEKQASAVGCGHFVGAHKPAAAATCCQRRRENRRRTRRLQLRLAPSQQNKLAEFLNDRRPLDRFSCFSSSLATFPPQPTRTQATPPAGGLFTPNDLTHLSSHT